jgi:hypothetical protein
MSWIMVAMRDPEGHVDLGVPRDVSIIVCDCGGLADRVECTTAERKEFGCGRHHDCCSRAFVCRRCGRRVAMSCKAPEMD